MTRKSSHPHTTATPITEEQAATPFSHIDPAVMEDCANRAPLLRELEVLSGFVYSVSAGPKVRQRQAFLLKCLGLRGDAPRADTKFEPGDMVRLRSGGPWMTVRSVYEDKPLKCEWFDEAFKPETFSTPTLIKIREG